MTTQDIALIVVTRNRAALLEKYLLAGLEQAAARGHSVVVVDQSDDASTKQLISGMAGVRYLRSEPGLSRGRNVAVEQTDEPLLAFTDDDVTIDAGWLDGIVATFDSSDGIGVVLGRGRDRSGALLPGVAAGVRQHPTNPFGLGSGYNMSFRRDALVAAGPFDVELGAGAPFRAAEDTDMVYRVLRAGWSAACSDDITVIHFDADRSRLEAIKMHYSYGYGAGAQLAKHASAGDAYAAGLLSQIIAAHLAWLPRLVVRGRLQDAAAQPAFIAGLIAGRRAWKHARAPRPD